MIATSTDYAITKRGMSPALRKRDKPLRTYGKRPQSTATAAVEPPTKKRKRATEGDIKSVIGEKEKEAKQPKLAEAASATTPPPEQAETTATKGSILSYFKRVEIKPTEQENKKDDIAQDGEQEAAQSPPRPVRRKPRILRLRATTSPTSEGADSHDQDSKASPTPRKGRSTREPLEQSNNPLGNQQPPAREKSGKKRAAAQAVQTTLNISPQAAFSECKVCDTVWNPLYPDDVKYHQKRHAAVVRKKRRREVEEL